MFDAARLVFIDETSANTKMMRLHGRCVRGERLLDHVPQGHWKTITFVAAPRTGRLHYSVVPRGDGTICTGVGTEEGPHDHHPLRWGGANRYLGRCRLHREERQGSREKMMAAPGLYCSPPYGPL
jgi:hypothetical protein